MRTITSTRRELFAKASELMPKVVISHDTAAYLHGLINEEPELLHLCIPHGGNRHKLTGAVVHQSLVPEVVEFGDLPVLSLPRTAVVFGASIVNPWDAAGVLYRAVHDLGASPNDLLRHAAMSPRGGRGMVSRAARELAAGARSVPEGVIWTACWELGLPVPALNVAIRVAGRRFHPDCLFQEMRLVVEIDGREYHSTPEQIAADAQRQALLEAAGYTVMRFAASNVLYRPAEVMSQIMMALGQQRPIHAWRKRCEDALVKCGAL